MQAQRQCATAYFAVIRRSPDKLLLKWYLLWDISQLHGLEARWRATKVVCGQKGDSLN
jgi:hypothetical protein